MNLKWNNYLEILTSKTAFLEHSAISVCENHIEEEAKADCSEEQEGGQKPPDLSLKYECWIEIQLKG